MEDYAARYIAVADGNKKTAPTHCAMQQGSRKALQKRS
jgi:hypothetical protein